MFHLTARVAWHDSRWNGAVCRKPSCNSFCAALDRIRLERDDAREDALAGKRWSTLDPDVDVHGKLTRDFHRTLTHPVLSWILR